MQKIKQELLMFINSSCFILVCRAIKQMYLMSCADDGIYDSRLKY